MNIATKNFITMNPIKGITFVLSSSMTTGYIYSKYDTTPLFNRINNNLNYSLSGIGLGIIGMTSPIISSVYPKLLFSTVSCGVFGVCISGFSLGRAIDHQIRSEEIKEIYG